MNSLTQQILYVQIGSFFFYSVYVYICVCVCVCVCVYMCMCVCVLNKAINILFNIKIKTKQLNNILMNVCMNASACMYVSVCKLTKTLMLTVTDDDREGFPWSFAMTVKMISPCVSVSAS